MFDQVREQFERNTTEHVITILKDDGLYRHIRLAQPGTRIWSWDLITWPGYLAIVGDIGDGWTFHRTDDMFEFFLSDGGSINPRYWWEKMPEQLRTAGRHFDERATLKAAHEYIDDCEMDDAATQAAHELLDSQWDSLIGEHDLMTTLRDFHLYSAPNFAFDDWYELRRESWDHHFLLACFAIVFGIKKYREATA